MAALHNCTNHRRRYSGLVLVGWCVHGQNLLNLRKIKQLSQLVVINEHCEEFYSSFGLTSSPTMNCSDERVQNPSPSRSREEDGIGSAMYFECHISSACLVPLQGLLTADKKEASIRNLGGEP